MVLIGIHIIDDNFVEELQKVITKNISIVQLFINNFKKSDINIIKNILNKHNIISVIHASYTINLSQNWNSYSFWIKQFINEIILGAELGAKYIVVHLGKKLDLTVAEGLNNMFTSLLYINSQTKKYDIKILLETSTGQGSEMCYDLNDFSNFYKKFQNNSVLKNRFGICLDTCHVFAAGYDLRGSKNIKIFFELINKLFGIESIKLVHLNDSKYDINSKLDRHANLSNGFIGKKSLIIISQFFNKLNVPIILETPYDKLFDDLNLLIK